MAKNRLVQMLQDARTEGYADGLWKGVHLGIDLAIIAGNHVHGHGDSRSTETREYIQKLVREIVNLKDPEATEAHIQYELARIHKPRRKKRLQEEVTGDE